MTNADVAAIEERFRARDAVLGIIGMGYVGLPLMLAATGAGFRVTGFDIDAPKVRRLNQGVSPLAHIGHDRVAAARAAGRFAATGDFSRIAEVDAVLICVPTPLGRHKEPDLSYVTGTLETIIPQLRAGQLVVLESTTWPGTTEEVVKPLIEAAGFRSGSDIFIAYSPEREDPGNADFATGTIPKVVGGDGAAALGLAGTLYDQFVSQTVPVSSPATAEAVKLTENIFRAVNIALVNELKLVFERMGIDVFEVIDAAKTKPFGYMPFYPGPGLGGHCIPIDPFYLTWRAREFGIATRFIELAGEINTAMPDHVVARTAEALDRSRGRGLNGANVLLLGVAYKKNVDDMRESPALVIWERLLGRGAVVAYHDPHVPEIPPTREHPGLAGRRSVPLDAERLAAADVVLVVTDHEAVDYALVAEAAALVVDTRNVMAPHARTLGQRLTRG
jgi:UDP-N-acetyl-D-glucosamine dehydrogenase